MTCSRLCSVIFSNMLSKSFSKKVRAIQLNFSCCHFDSNTSSNSKLRKEKIPREHYRLLFKISNWSSIPRPHACAKTEFRPSDRNLKIIVESFQYLLTALKHDKKSTEFVWVHTSYRIRRIHAPCSMPHTQKHPVWIAASFVSGRHLAYLQHGHHQKFVVVRRLARLPRVTHLVQALGSCSLSTPAAFPLYD